MKILVLSRKIIENLLIFMHSSFPKKCNICSRKTVITWERLVIGSCATTRWIAFSMLYRMVYKITSHWNAPILAWSACFDRKYPFWTNLVQKVKIISLSWNLVPTLIRICWIQWRCSLFSFSNRNVFLGQIGAKKSKLSV